MVLIPPDAGIRMRMQTDASLQPVQPARAITPDLPDLQPGQQFSARIVENLADNLYRALVAGRTLTLQLPEGANPGDSLELVVVDRSAKALIAQRVEGQANPATPTAEPYRHAEISRAGQMISQLLLTDGETPQPAPLTRGQPLLAQAPASAAELVPTLAKAVSQSGLFYEAHQAEWIAGRRPVESLQAEPQAQVANNAPASARTAAPSSAVLTPTPVGTPAADAQPGGNAANATPSQAIPEPLRPIVQQQLDAVATQRLVWHGEVWPGQTLDWKIERDRIDEREAATAEDQEARWNTTLRLTMPRLGTVEASLSLNGNTLRLGLGTDSETAAADLRAQSAELLEALEGAGITLRSIDVKHGG